MIENQDITSWEMARIRTLSDPRLILLISLVHDFGWPNARWMLHPESEKELPAGSPKRTIEPHQLVALRTLDDLDLTMILSDTHDHGWPMAARTLELAVEASWKGPSKHETQ